MLNLDCGVQKIKASPRQPHLNQHNSPPLKQSAPQLRLNMADKDEFPCKLCLLPIPLSLYLLT